MMGQKIEWNTNKWYYLGGYKMKKILLGLSAILAVIPLFLTSCQPAGPLTTKDYTLADFTNVQAGNAFQVIITPSDTFSVAVTAPENRFNNIKVEKSGSTLEVTVSGLAFWNNWGSSRPKLEVSMPGLESLNLSGASTGTAKGFTSTKNFQLELSGASNADIDIQAFDTSVSISGASKLTGNLAVHDIRLNVSGASNTTVTGTGNNLNLQVSGASGAALDNLAVQDARAELSGASHATVNASGTLDVFVSGASNLTYVDNPTLGTVDVTGASSIHQK